MDTKFYGSFVLVLHSHIPYVIGQNRLEEEMLLDAAIETYIPLLGVFNRLVSEGISPRTTIGISPVLAEQLAHPEFKTKLREYCELKAEFARQDSEEFRSEHPHPRWLARRWEQFYTETDRLFNRTYGKDIIGAFKELQDNGHIELITCAATHPYLPALLEDTSIEAQIKLAIQTHRHHFGNSPRGIWVPECGYRPAGQWRPRYTSRQSEASRFRHGVETVLSENELEFFVIDQHQLEKANPTDLHKTLLDTYRVGGSEVPKQPVTVFTRDSNLSEQVWLKQRGYPGNGAYLDFHKRHAEGVHRYWKITDEDVPMGNKQFYHPDDAAVKIAEHAGHYKWLITQSLRTNFEHTGQAKLIMTAFDTELFGHWWFEGPEWLYTVLKYIDADPEIGTMTCSEYLDQQPAYNWVYLPESSWGANFDSSTWLNPEVEWTWERIYHAEHEMSQLAKAFGEKDDPTLQRILNQSIRELLILQASDWQFMVTNWSTRDLAEKRLVERHEDFKRLAKLAWDYGGKRDVSQREWHFLHECEQLNQIFTDVDINWYIEKSP
jgi:1,4-alpha-glucan branching enzyme